MELEGKAALVTGGGRRVGRAIVLELAAAGCDVAIHCHRSKPQAEQLAGQVAASGRRAIVIEGDLCEASAWPAIISGAAEKLGRLDVLVNNAALFTRPEADSLDAFDPAAWDHLLRVNLLAPVALCHHARQHLSARGEGVIINLLDIAARRPWPAHLSYCASKAALWSMTQALARALAPDVRVCGVAPGIAAFPEHYGPEMRRDLVERVPLGRAGTPEDVARATRFLVANGEFVTGEVVTVDGGRHLV